MEPGDPDGLPTEAKCWQVAIRPEGDDTDASVETDRELHCPVCFAAPPLDADACLSLLSAHVTHICAHAFLPLRASAAARAKVGPLLQQG